MSKRRAPMPGRSWSVNGSSINDEFDELVVGSWLHIERMSERSFWINVADIKLSVVLRTDGRVDLHIEDEGKGGKLPSASIERRELEEGTWWGK